MAGGARVWKQLVSGLVYFIRASPSRSRIVWLPSPHVTKVGLLWDYKCVRKKQVLSEYSCWSVTEEKKVNMADGGFNSRSIGLRMQKKLAGKLSSKSMAKQFIDDEMGVLLDTINLILRKEMCDHKKADKVITNMIKITVKLGLLYKNSQFNQEEIALGLKFRTKLRQAALTVISFHEVDFTYDRSFLIKTVSDCGEILHKLVERHLTNKSHQRIESIITAFSNPELLDKLFLPEGAYHEHLDHSKTRPADILIPNWVMGRTAALDVSVTSPLNPQTLLVAGVTATAAALTTEERKHDENDPKCSELGWVCIPVVAESYGAWGREATLLFSTIASRIATLSNKPKSVTLSDIYGRLNLQLVRANATSILARLMPPSY
eukprot:Em0009g1066a